MSAWTCYLGYILAFALGVIAANQLEIVTNGREIRRNSRVIRQQAEAALKRGKGDHR